MKKKQQKKRPRTEPKSVKEQPAEPRVEGEHAWDFGGLPARDLKKNLGCG